MVKLHLHTRPRLTLLAAAAIAALASGTPTRAAEVNNTTFDIDVVASRISVQSLQGSSSSTKLFGLFGSSKSTPALVGKVYIAYFEIEQSAKLNNATFRTRVLVDSVHSNGAEVRIGGAVIK